MADNAWNIRMKADKNDSTGVKAWTLEVATHFTFPDSERTDLKTAADTSQASFDSAVASSSLGSAQKSWYDGLTSAHKAHVRQAAQLLP